MKPKLKQFVNLPFYAQNRTAAGQAVFDLFKQNKSIQVVTVNAEMLLVAVADERLAKIIQQAEFLVVDSTATNWWLRFIGQRKLPRLSGVDLAEQLLQIAGTNNLNVLLLGGKNNFTALAAANNCQKKFGIKNINSDYGPTLTGQEGESELFCSAELNSKISAAQIIFVGFGHNKQERWIAANKNLFSAKIWIGVGGAIDYWSGEVRRAPRGWQTLGLEWLWRLGQEPWRLGRIWRAVIIFPIRAITEFLLY